MLRIHIRLSFPSEMPRVQMCNVLTQGGPGPVQDLWSKEFRSIYYNGLSGDTSEFTRKTIIKIIATSPCPLDGLKSTLDSMTLNEMDFTSKERLFVNARGVLMPVLSQSLGTNTFWWMEPSVDP